MRPILILAAGASSRMGGADKLLQEVDGIPLLVRIVRQAVATGEQVYVAIPGPWHPRYKALRNEAVTCYDIPDSKEGMGGTLRGAVKRLPPCATFMVLLADLPDITTDDINKVFAASIDTPNARIWRGATANGKPGHPIVFDCRLRSEFTDLNGDDGAKSIVAKHQNTTILVTLDDNRALTDLDTPEDWQNWKASRQTA